MNTESSRLDADHPNPQELAVSPIMLGLEIHPMVQNSLDAFRRALPELLKIKKFRRWWVAFHGDERVGIAATEDELYAECDRRGLKDHEYVVCCIVPQIPRDIDATPPFDV